MKTRIVEHLGKDDVLLPSLIAQGLLANDRVKVRLGVLQAAGQHARQPEAAPFELAEECRKAGIDPMEMGALVSGAAKFGDESITAPGLRQLGAAIWEDVADMLRAVQAGNAAEGNSAAERLSAIHQGSALGSSDHIALSEIAELTGLSGHGGESLHRLVMILHKSLNRLSADQAEEELAGAHVYGLRPEDRPAVEAFMRGLESTRKLKFNHPGLSTLATRSGERLTLQNDIGETDAHVIVVAVEQTAVTVTYTDVHRPRAKFFIQCLRDFPVEWSGLDTEHAKGLADDEVFYLVTGRYRSKDTVDRDSFLAELGASLVFLIDWNKARKVFRDWIPKNDATRILEWAQRNRVGHRAFLELGGRELVSAAVHHAAPLRIGFGERLDGVLGREAAVDFLKAALRISTEALLEGISVRLARDRIEADLIRRLQRVDGALFAVVIRQAGLARDIAADIAHFMAARQAGRRADGELLAARSRQIEEKADQIASEARSEIARLQVDRDVERLVNCIEEAIDELEQAAFVTSLAPDDLPPDLLEPLAQLSAAAVAGAEAAAIGAAAAAEVPDGNRVDVEDALAACGRLVAVEHDADAAERALTATVLRGNFELRNALSALELGRAIERCTDRLAGFGHLLRDHVLADLSR